jgi:hypothetical protein
LSRQAGKPAYVPHGWTAEQEAALRSFLPFGRSAVLRALAGYGKSHSAVYVKTRRLGLRWPGTVGPRATHWTAEEEATLQKCLAVRDVVGAQEALDRSHLALRRRAKKLGLSWPRVKLRRVWHGWERDLSELSD